MTSGILQIVLYLVVLGLLVKPLGLFMTHVYQGERTFLDPILGPVERLIYRLGGIDPAEDMTWKTYALALLLFNLVGFTVLYLILRIQAWLPFNPENFEAIPAHTTLNIAVSFASNTNWQNYGGEATLGYLPQMLGLTVQNFVSAAMGMAVLAAFCRGLARTPLTSPPSTGGIKEGVGNFWTDLVRTTLYILLPLSLIIATILVSQGVIQTFSDYQTVPLLQPTVDAGGNVVTEQVLAVGPAASQIAIKQLGTNGGGFFNVNSAHPFENATPLSNFFQMLSILLIPAALCYTFGRMVGDTRQGWALLIVMNLFFIPLLAVSAGFEYNGNPLLTELGIDQTATDLQPGGNMEGKEVRFGIANSALWATATTAASNGSVNSMHDSYTPLGGLAPTFLMQLGEVIYGGVGSGLYGLLIFAIIAVFVAGLMVGRTPEYLGKKIEAFDMKMAAIAILVPPMMVLLGTAGALLTEDGLNGIQDPGPHGFSEVLYAYSSQGNNNGSAFAGYGANTPFVNSTGGLAMLFARYWVALPALAIAGSLVRKKKVPVSAGTLPTHGPLFIGWLAMVVLIVGALSFLPALALGPIVEQLLLNQGVIF